MDQARRYSNGKIRYELIPNTFKKELAKVYTMGAEKYSIKNEQGEIIDDASSNWRKGQFWLDSLASIYRHLEKFQAGEDYDYEFPDDILEKYGPSMHLANAAWGIASLIEYYRIHPEMDNRLCMVQEKPVIGIDIDECICNWVEPWCARFGYPIPEDWHFSYAQGQHFNEDFSKEALEAFYLDLKPKVKPSEIPFDFSYYVTSRSVPVELTQKWIQMHGFPTVPVYSLGIGESKVDTIKELGITHFIDDNYKTYCDLSREGIAAFLMNAKHNEKYPVGYRRIKDFNDLKERFL